MQQMLQQLAEGVRLDGSALQFQPGLRLIHPLRGRLRLLAALGLVALLRMFPFQPLERLGLPVGGVEEGQVETLRALPLLLWPM